MTLPQYFHGIIGPSVYDAYMSGKLQDYAFPDGGIEQLVRDLRGVKGKQRPTEREAGRVSGATGKGCIVRESFNPEELVAVFGGITKLKMEKILESIEAAPKEA